MNAHKGSTAGTRRDALRERDDAVIARLSTLATALDGEPDPAFRAATRTRLVAMAAVRTPAPARAARSTAPARWRRRLTAGLAAAVVVAAALATLVAFAAGSGPGDPLYGVKRGTEQTELALAGNSRRGPALLDLARTRLAELRALAGEPAPEPALVVQTLTTMDSETADAASWFEAKALDSRSAAHVDQLSHWTSVQSSSLTALRGHLPAAVSTAVEHSLALLAATRSRADALRATLATAGRPPATGTTGGSVTSGSSPDAPSSVVRGPGVGTAGTVPGRSGGASLTPPPGAVPTRPPAGASSGVGGLSGLPTLPGPGAGGPGAGLPLPTLPVPTGICAGPVAHC